MVEATSSDFALVKSKFEEAQSKLDAAAQAKVKGIPIGDAAAVILNVVPEHQKMAFQGFIHGLCAAPSVHGFPAVANPPAARQWCSPR